MTVSEKIKFFFLGKKITFEEIGNLFGTSGQTIGNYVNGRREIPTDFFLWLKANYPEIDFNKLFSGSDSGNITIDGKPINTQQILLDIEKILNNHLK
jgi:transcriptional regulator with XRE-family HTH domain